MTRLRRNLPLLLAGLLLLALLFALNVLATYTIFTSRYPGANDFYSRWGGAQAFWRQGINPYSEEATLLIQDGIYGRPARPGEDPGPFAYPFYVAILIWPLVYLPYPWASAIWLALLEFALLAATFLIFNMYRWRPPLWLAAFSAVWVILFYHGARTIILGQVAGLVFLGLALALWALHRRLDGLAGAALAFCTIKPQMVYLIIPFLLWWGWRQRRWRFLDYFGGTLAGLVVLSLLFLPTWPLDFLAQMRTYNSYQALGYSNNIGSPVWIFSHVYLPFLGRAGEIILVAALLAYTGYTWLAYRSRPEAFHWLVGLALLVTNLITPRAATTNYIVLLLPLFMLLVVLSRRLRYGFGWTLAVQVLLLVGLWLLFATTVQGNLEGPELYLPLPLLLLAALLLFRRPFMAESPTPGEVGSGPGASPPGPPEGGATPEILPTGDALSTTLRIERPLAGPPNPPEGNGIKLSQCHSDQREESLLSRSKRPGQGQITDSNEKFLPVSGAFIRRLQGFLLSLRPSRNDRTLPIRPPSLNSTALPSAGGILFFAKRPPLRGSGRPIPSASQSLPGLLSSLLARTG